MNVLVNKPWCRWFHNSRSMLGHLQYGCELCSSEECRDSFHRAGPVALSMCRECAATNRVRFTLHKGERDVPFFFINDANASRTTSLRAAIDRLIVTLTRL